MHTLLNLRNFMRTNIIILFAFTNLGYAQTLTNFEKEIVPLFPLLNFPVDSVQKIKPMDTLDTKKYNKWLLNKIDKKPIYIKNGKRELEKDYYGKLSSGPQKVGTMNSKTLKHYDTTFYSYVKILGRINLQPNYYSLIIKAFGFESTYYDIHNFSKEGKLMSVVPLYYFENKKVMKEIVGNLHVKSSIAKDGKIYWWEYYPRRTRERVYFLNKNGFFEIISEKVKGQIEY